MAKSRYSQTQKKVLKDFLEFSRKGDKILNSVIFNIIDSYAEKSMMPILREKLVSNDIISNFEIPYKLKNFPYGATPGSLIYSGRQGDLVEAYVWFLYINYGLESVKDYIIKNFKLLISKNLVE